VPGTQAASEITAQSPHSKCTALETKEVARILAEQLAND
jgi:hypothetical protein